MSAAVGQGFPWPPVEAFWSDEFPARTKEATRPALFKGLLPEGRISMDDVLEGLGRLRLARAQGADSAARARVYVDESRRDELVEPVLDAPAWSSTPEFIGWMQDLVGAERFSLIINNLETLAPKLTEVLGDFLASAFAGWGLPIGGSEQVAFIGNYSGTAFGVHEGYEDAFLCHLGPGVKDFYCWDPDDYESLTGSKDPTFGDYAWLLAKGEKFVMEPGDVLFLPRRVFHVGVQEELSVSVAVPLYTYPDIRLLALSMLPDLTNEILAAKSGALDEPSAMHSLAAGPAPVARRMLPAGDELVFQLGELVHQRTGDLLDGRWQKLLSNGGWEVVGDDLARQDATPQDVGTVVRPGSLLRLRRPFQVRTTATGILYLRGAQVEVPDGTDADDLADQLNGGHTLTVPDDPGQLALLRSMAGTGGLVIDPPAIDKEATE